MRVLFLASVTLALVLPSPSAADLALAKVALHLKPHATNACLAPPTIPCSSYTTAGRVGVSYDAYLVVADVSPFEGIKGVSCGIQYDPALASGVDLYSWTLCADGLEWPNEGPNGIWPASGGGNRITWTTCQTRNYSPNGAHAVAGVFYIYAYAADQLQITENNNLDSGPELKVANCAAIEAFLPPAYGARADFSPTGASAGYNPCNNFEPKCNLPEASISLNYISVGAYKDASFSIINGGGYGPLQGAITENCPEYTIESGGSYYLPYAGNTANIRVRVAPNAPGPLDCRLHLGATCRDVRILGTAVISPQTLLSPASLNESMRVFTSRALPFQVSNIGSPVLEWSTRLEFGSLDDVENALAGNISRIESLIPGLVTGADVYSSGGNVLFTGPGGLDPGRGGNYFLGSFDRLSVMVADFAEVESLAVRGALKQHTGQEAVDRITMNWHDIPYDVIIHRTFGHPDYASLNHIFILPNLSATFWSDPVISNDDVIVGGLRQARRVYYLMFMGNAGQDYSLAQTTNIAQAFLDAALPYSQWATVNISQDNLAPGQSALGNLDVTTLDLQPGTYHAQLVIPSNSLSTPAAVIPITLDATEGETVLKIEPETLNPSSKAKWVNASLQLGNGSAGNILLGTLRANGTLIPDATFFHVADADSDGIPEAHVRFDRTTFITALPPEDQVDVVVTGETSTGQYFNLRDTVRLLRPHVLHPHGGERLLAGTFVDAQFDLNETPDADSVVVAYSPNGGTTWQSIGVTEGENHLSWRLPDEPGTQYLVAVHAYRSGVLLGYDQSGLFSVSTATGVDPTHDARTTALFQNHPNPFRALTHIPFSVASPGNGRIEVFNLAGMRVRMLVSGQLEAGVQEVRWDGRSDAGDRLPPGLYVVRLRTAGSEASRRVFLVP